MLNGTFDPIKEPRMNYSPAQSSQRVSEFAVEVAQRRMLSSLGVEVPAPIMQLRDGSTLDPVGGPLVNEASAPSGRTTLRSDAG